MSGWHTKGKLRPHIWCTGPDPVRHEMYHAWQVHKAQCNFRDEEFNLTFEQYEDLWADDWNNRGRSPEHVCMTRIDWLGAWEIGNVEIITRAAHFKRQGEHRFQRHQERKLLAQSKKKPKKAK